MELAVMPFSAQDIGWISLAAAVLLSLVLVIRLAAASPWLERRHRRATAAREAARASAERIATHL